MKHLTCYYWHHKGNCVYREDQCLYTHSQENTHVKRQISALKGGPTVAVGLFRYLRYSLEVRSEEPSPTPWAGTGAPCFRFPQTSPTPGGGTGATGFRFPQRSPTPGGGIGATGFRFPQRSPTFGECALSTGVMAVRSLLGFRSWFLHQTDLDKDSTFSLELVCPSTPHQPLLVSCKLVRSLLDSFPICRSSGADTDDRAQQGLPGLVVHRGANPKFHPSVSAVRIPAYSLATWSHVTHLSWAGVPPSAPPPIPGGLR